MPKLSGVFEQFKSLEKLPLEEINRWLKIKLDVYKISNYLANRVFYPQTIPATTQDMELDLAILRVAIKQNPAKFYDSINKKVAIPFEFSLRFHPLTSLVACFIDSIHLKELTEVFLSSSGNRKLICSVCIPVTLPKQTPITVSINQQNYKLKLNTLTLLPIKEKKLQVVIPPTFSVLADAGELGVFIDLRRRSI
ncbi:hypothetical protein HY025_05245 [Candidatus Daviesbacteria bacterium]|nr:hypothetical protein [Candidatus Daviesbacteria bacterium]